MENVKNDANCHVTRQNQNNPAGGGAKMTVKVGLMVFRCKLLFPRPLNLAGEPSMTETKSDSKKLNVFD